MGLSQEEMDAVIYDAREGDLEYLTEIFSKIVPGHLITTVKDEITQSTPVHMAAANGHTAVVEYLLSLVPHDAAVAMANAQNDLGNTPLHWAAYSGHLAVVQLLVEKYGADVFLKNSLGHDALFEAERNGKTDVENWFLKNFAPEETVTVEDAGEDTKITYKPGQESYTIDQEAAAALKEKVAGVEQQTEKLEL